MVVHHRPGADARHRPGRLPGMRHGRHHAPVRQAQLPGQGRERSRVDDQEGVLSRDDRHGPGPVLVDIPKDVTQASTEFVYPKTVSLRSYNPVTKGHAGQIKKAVQLLLEAKRPMVYTGGGVILNNASSQLTRLVRLLGFPCTNTLMGLGAFPGHRPAVHRHARHARHVRVEHGDAALRRAVRRRRALRRPRDRRPEALLPRRPQDHPHRHRSVVDLQAREGRRADRRLRRRRAGRDAEDPRVVAAAARPRGAEGVVVADQGVAAQGLPQVRPHEQAHQAAVRDREALRAHQGRRVRHVRRRPAPDVGRAVLQVRQAAPLDQFRRPRHDGLRPAGGDGRADGQSRTRRSPA